MFAVGVRLGPGDAFEVHAPFGLEDLFAMKVRHNVTRMSPNFAKVAGAAQARWPELEIIG